jgi:hypothetical protein
LLDSNTRNEIMQRPRIAAGNNYIAKLFLTDDEADALTCRDDIVKTSIADDKLTLTYEELVELLIAMQA